MQVSTCYWCGPNWTMANTYSTCYWVGGNILPLFKLKRVPVLSCTFNLSFSYQEFLLSWFAISQSELPKCFIVQAGFIFLFLDFFLLKESFNKKLSLIYLEREHILYNPLLRGTTLLLTLYIPEVPSYQKYKSTSSNPINVQRLLPSSRILLSFIIKLYYFRYLISQFLFRNIQLLSIQS